MFRYAEVAPRIYVSNASYYWNEDYVTDLWVNNGWFDKKDADAIKTHYTGYSFTTKRGLKVIGLNSNSIMVTIFGVMEKQLLNRTNLVFGNS